MIEQYDNTSGASDASLAEAEAVIGEENVKTGVPSKPSTLLTSGTRSLLEADADGHGERRISAEIDGQSQVGQAESLEQSARKCEPPEGHDRQYHLKTADGGDDYHIPIIKSLLVRDDVTLNEAIVYGYLLDKLGRGHSYCFPTQETIARELKIGGRTVERAMSTLKAKGLVTPVFHGHSNMYFLPDRHQALARLDGQGPPQGRTAREGQLSSATQADLTHQLRHTGGTQMPARPHRPT